MQFESLRRPCYHGWHAKSGDPARISAAISRFSGFRMFPWAARHRRGEPLSKRPGRRRRDSWLVCRRRPGDARRERGFYLRL